MKTVAGMLVSIGLCTLLMGNSCVNKKGLPALTTLDSLQGSWVSIDDNLHTMEINGRVMDADYKDVHLPHEDFRIYFSDTLIGNDKLFDQIKIDKTTKAGNFLIAIENNDRTAWCYEINGFYANGKELTFSMSSVWAGYRPQVFRKQ